MNSNLQANSQLQLSSPIRVPVIGRFKTRATNYYQDLALVNEVRELTEAIVDYLWDSYPNRLSEGLKLKTHRKAAQESFYRIRKASIPNSVLTRKVLRYQIRCVERNQKVIAILSRNGSLVQLPRRMYQGMLIGAEICRQQRLLLSVNQKNSLTYYDKIVSLSDPYFRYGNKP